LGETKDYTIGICCFSAKHTTWRRKSKYLLVRNQDNLFERGDMSIRGLLFQWAFEISHLFSKRDTNYVSEREKQEEYM
jgi:hypothetical protein